MRNWALCLLCISFLIPFGIQAQSNISKPTFTKPGDIRDAFRSQNCKVLVGFDSRRSFVSTLDVNVFGFRAGLDFDGLVRIGGGLYSLFSKIEQQYVLPDPVTGSDNSFTARLRFNYVTFFFEPILMRSKRWEFSLPWHIGIGDTFFEGAGFEARQPRTILLTEASLIGQYKIFQWIGVGAGFGYRRFLKGNNFQGYNFHAPIYMFNLKIFVGYIYTRIFKPEKLDEW